MSKDKIFVTGANDFLGSSIVTKLLESKQVIVGIREGCKYSISDHVVFRYPDINIKTDWNRIINKVKVIVHTAARVHVMKDKVADPLTEFRHVNVDGTLNLARQAAGIGRFIFISSIKVNGEMTLSQLPFKSDDAPAPCDPYGISKLEAENGLMKIARETGMEVVVLRPPLVYGPGVKANFQKMIHWLNKGVPLPLGSIHNKWTLVALDNLVDLINTCIDHPAAANQVFLAGDDEDVSTSLLLQKIGQSLGKPARLIKVSPKFIKLGAAILGKSDTANRLLGNQQVDIS
jgi:nucleoside-diphosphate-sugar epimerase